MDLKKNLTLLKPYVAGKPLSEKEYIKLNANECPLPLPQKLYQKTAKLRSLNRYHEGSGLALRKKLSSLHKLDENQFILGNGSGELIQLYLSAFCEKGKEAVIPENTFSLYEIYALLNESKIEKISMTPALEIDLDKILACVHSDTAVIFLCNPNNPTGHTYSYENLESFFSKIPSTAGIFLDEAYIHFSDIYSEEKTKNLIQKFKNLFILRTFSKMGLAGFRIGYGISNSETIELLNRVRPPFNTNRYAQEAAETMLELKEFSLKVIQENKKERDFLSKQMQDLGIKVFSSGGNFIFIQSRPGLDKLLEESKILIRNAYSFGFSSDYYRITVGTQKENRILIKNLRRILK